MGWVLNGYSLSVVTFQARGKLCISVLKHFVSAHVQAMLRSSSNLIFNIDPFIEIMYGS